MTDFVVRVVLKNGIQTELGVADERMNKAEGKMVGRSFCIHQRRAMQ
jgi:hypothetical protein